jgi:hypothetical protein
MFPGPKVSTSGQQLSRLAEIAEAVSMHHRGVQQNVLPSGSSVFNVAQLMAQNQPAASLVTAKRSLDIGNDLSLGGQIQMSETASVAKRRKTSNADEDDLDDDDKDVRFREYQAEIWSEKFEDLCEFRRQYGHCHVPHSFEENSPL